MGVPGADCQHPCLQCGVSRGQSVTMCLVVPCCLVRGPPFGGLHEVVLGRERL